jgi:MFS family permease
MFFGSFAWQFVYVSLPFHIQRISPYDPAATLAWTGWTLGITSLVTVLTSPFLGRWAGRGDPRACYVRVEALQGLAFLGMALARTLPELFLARVVLGFMGAGSTVAFIIAGRAGDAAEIRRGLAALQSAMMAGQVIGPLAGAVAAARLGFRPSFVLGALILFGCAAMVQWGVPAPAGGAAPVGPRRRVPGRDVAVASAMVLGGSVQVFFLTAILPQVLPDLGVDPALTLEVAGLIIFASGTAAALGTLAAPRLAEVVAERRLIEALLVGSSGLVAALALAPSAWAYGAVRLVQMLAIAPVFPLVVTRIAQHGAGEAIGIINSARIGASFVGPIVATSLLAWSSAPVLYLLLAAIGLACVPLVGRRESRATR